MVKNKQMDEVHFAKLLKEINVTGELIRSRQDEEQSLMDQFDSESKRFFFGKISENAISASVRKTNAEVARLNREISGFMRRSEELLEKARSFVRAQKPVDFKATISGMKDPRAPKKKKSRKKAVKKVKKKTVKKAPKKVAKKVKKAKKSTKKKSSKKKK